jgi:hypothetical protein
MWMRTAILTALLGTALAAQTGYDKFLTAADVQKAAGAAGVKVVPRGSRTGAGGDLNFVGSDDQLVLMVSFGNAQSFKKARETKEMDVGGQKYPMVLFAHAVDGLGDEAFAAPPGPVQYVIYARKGNQSVAATTYFQKGSTTKTRLSEAQLKDIVKTIFSRM